MTATDTDEAGFHAAIEADPDDATPMLVFADWLQDRDDPRAVGCRVMGALGLRPLYSWYAWEWYKYRLPWCTEKLWCTRYPSHAAALDAAALEWHGLTDAEREKILADAAVGAS